MRTLLKRAVPRLEITEHLIRSDIEKLISVEIHESLRNYSPVIKAEAQKDLEARTQIMFLWVTLVLKELRRFSSIEDVRHTLQHVPHDLDREYHRLFFQLMTRTRGSRAKPSISMKRAGKWLCKAADEINLLLPDQQHQRGQLWFLFIVEDLALMGRYELAQSMAREVLEIKEISYSDDEEDLDFGPLEPLVSKLKSIGSIDVNYKESLRCYSLLMAAEGIKDTAEKAKRWERKSTRTYDGVESFSKRIPLIKLKQIETGLRQDGGSLNTARGYCQLGRFFFEQGDTEAADLVSSDAASRIFSNSSSRDPSWTFRSASDVYLYAGNFSKCISLLCQAYQKSLHVNGDAAYSFQMESVYSWTYIHGLATFEKDLEKVGLRLYFQERSCEHLSKASRAMDEIDRYKNSRPQGEQREDEQYAEDSRKQMLRDLKARLEDLHVGSMSTEAMARLGPVAPGAEVSSEGNS